MCGMEKDQREQGARLGNEVRDEDDGNGRPRGSNVKGCYSTPPAATASYTWEWGRRAFSFSTGSVGLGMFFLLYFCIRLVGGRVIIVASSQV